jgi:hypothetical protein
MALAVSAYYSKKQMFVVVSGTYIVTILPHILRHVLYYMNTDTRTYCLISLDTGHPRMSYLNDSGLIHLIVAQTWVLPGVGGMTWVEKRSDKQHEVYEMEQASKFGGNLPEMNFRAGAVSASIWRNQIKTKDGQDREIMSVTFNRSYKDKDSDEWKRTSSLRTMDLPKAVVVLNKAFEYLILNNQNTGVEVN